MRRVSSVLGLLVIALAAWWVFPPRQPRSSTPPRNILLITIDTLRADSIGAYGNARAATPWLDRLAAGGVRFDNARAHNVVTLPSHANILTGRLPPEHGIRDNAGFRLASTEETLATRLKSNGFRTGAFVSAFPLDSRFGLARGFDVYDDSFVDARARPAMVEQERAGAETVAAAQRWLQSGDRSARWFCWIHLYEPHFPYAPPEPFASRFADAPYAGEVAAADAALGPILQPIVEAGVAADTLVIVTSDHGEALGEHDEATHGIFAYDATLKVPLLFYYPRQLPARIVSTPAGHVDILPSIMQALDLPADSELNGRSLDIEVSGTPAVETQELYFEALSGSLNRGWAPLTGVLAGGMKYIELPLPELYDMQADPGERRNLAAERPQQVNALRQVLRAFDRGTLRRAPETAEVKERLRSLGYVASEGNGRVKYSDEDDPKRLIRFESKLQDVVGQYLSGNLQDALARCRELVAERPSMRVALLQLAQLERESGNLAAAIAALRRAREINPGDAETASLLGAYLTAQNNPADAIAVLEPFANGPEPDAQVLMTLSLALARTNRTGEALGLLDRARGQDPTNALILVHVGTVQLMARRRAEARQAFEAALALNPDVARAHSSLAAMAVEDGRGAEALSHWRSAVTLDPGEHEKLLGVGISLASAGRNKEARPYLELFAERAPPDRYQAEIARVRRWLGERL
jgi:arylsulfatase A-like enzyme/Flp pilus assembly protein TadD